jgi:hypothetical protein
MPIPRVQIHSAIEDTSKVLSVVAVLLDSATVCPDYLEGLLERSVLVAASHCLFQPPSLFGGRARVTAASVTVVKL